MELAKRKVISRITKAIYDFGMVSFGDRVAVAISGGIDSLVMLDALLSAYVPEVKDFLAVHIDLGFDKSGRSAERLRNFLESRGVKYVLESTDIGVRAHKECGRESPCFLCSFWRRKRIFELAVEHGCNRIAMGHHKDDIVETLFLNIMYHAEFGTIPPVQEYFGGLFSLIRPMVYVSREMILHYAKREGIVPLVNLCPTAEHTKRKKVQEMLVLMGDRKRIRDNAFLSMSNIKWERLVRLQDDKD